MLKLSFQSSRQMATAMLLEGSFSMELRQPTRAATSFQPTRQKCMLRPAEEIKLEIRSDSTIANWGRFPRLAREVCVIYA